jgi:flagellar hook-basal body complex protein FliE
MTTITSLPGASRAYQSAQKIPTAILPSEESRPKTSFAEMVENTALDAVETIREGDRAAVAGLKGELSTQEVVEATMAMQSTLQVTVAVRDKVIEAYQEIMRMAV